MDGNWHRNAVIYGIDVSRFQDSNGDGIGDFPGLTSRLGYLADLGVSCLWLLPFFPSPRRDDGYDVANHFAIDPRFGTLDDFLAFLHAAGERGMRVLVDQVVNHTSDEHPWFQASRRDPGSRYRDYYVWTGSPPPAHELKPIFPGQVDTVWTYDEVARAYYFHQFYPFEPGLNGADERVREEIRSAMDFWLSLGVDGFRLDAISRLLVDKVLPKAAPEDGDAIMRGFYAYVKSRRAHAIVLAEADVAPEKVERYFASPGELDLLFNFTVDDAIFHAFAAGCAAPVVDALRRMPRPGAIGGWANFLRNLDELNLEWLSDEAREKVVERFGPDPSMRIYDGRGLRRRLAPMLDGDARRIACAMSLLFALPGTPLLVYGDEIGLGEDLSQPGRRAVRCPMQWSEEENGGFSSASADALVQPVLREGPFGYPRVNAESQRRDPASLWHVVSRLAHARRAHPSMGEFTCRPFDTDHDAVLGLAHDQGHGLLVLLHNLSGKRARCTPRLALASRLEARDVFGGGSVALGPDEAVELEPYGYRWLELAWLG